MRVIESPMLRSKLSYRRRKQSAPTSSHTVVTAAILPHSLPVDAGDPGGRSSTSRAGAVRAATRDREGAHAVPGPVDVAGGIAVGALDLGRLHGRFVQGDATVLDEAFGRGSDESAQYGLQLFQQLNLQLLVVTPLQKIHIIEPFVSSVGFVHNDDGRASMLRNLTIEEYRAEKAAHRA